ncbi:MAG: hypothetical protein WKF77_00080 [Planctomycetaceae bacterium]
MINRRRALQSFLSFAAASIVSRNGALLGSLPASETSAADKSRSALAEMLRDTIELCRTMKSALPESQRMCEIALVRELRSVESSPAFWQACADSVSRLEVAVSECKQADSRERRTTAATLYRLRNLRTRLAKQTVQAIGGLGRLA